MRTKERTKSLGEVFTPEFLIERMYRRLPDYFFTDYTKTVLDNSCGNGNFLVKMMEYRMMNGISHRDAISTIYGIDIDELNVKECKERLLIGKDDIELKKIVDRNIICADTLNENHPGWNEVGYMWDETKKPHNKYSLDLFME